MGTLNIEKYRYQIHTCTEYAYGTRNLFNESYSILLSCFLVVGSTKTYG